MARVIGAKKPADLSHVVLKRRTQRKAELDKAKLDIVDNPGVYRCCSCGVSYVKQEKYFSASRSPFFAGNNGRLPICDSCVDAFVEQYMSIFKEPEEAIRRMCMHWDIYCCDTLMVSTVEKKSLGERVRTIIRSSGLTQYQGKTFDTYLNEIGVTAICDLVYSGDDDSLGITQEPDEAEDEPDQPRVTAVAMKRWADIDIEPHRIGKLETHYKFLKDCNPNCDSNQEVFIKDLCYIKLLQSESIKSGDIDKFDKLTKQYRETWKQAGLKSIADADKNEEETYGMAVAMMAQYTPEEYYKNKSLYKDMDGILDYFKRMVLRPLKNLLTGSSERDPEYSVPEDGDGA